MFTCPIYDILRAAGVLLSKQELLEISDICKKANCWLVCDNTYEHFCNFTSLSSLAAIAYVSTTASTAAKNDPAPSIQTAPNDHQAAVEAGSQGHYCVSGEHVVHVFSFSKAYGMMGWRVGYIAYPDPDGRGGALGGNLLKTQDTICICACQVSQHAALGALTGDGSFVRDRVAGLEENRQLIADALMSTLGPENVFGGYAIFFWAKLPAGCKDDVLAVQWLVK
ncbi:hypothetical protein CEUSTIGMA_g13897.t1, partial [Chlamydomonas eustigma]